MNQLTEAVDPVKIYEYLSQGKPVVSVPLPELAPLSELVYFAAGPEEFSSQIDRVEGVRSELNKGRTLMLYRMNRQLTPEQRTKLKAMHDRYEASRKK